MMLQNDLETATSGNYKIHINNFKFSDREVAIRGRFTISKGNFN